MLGAARGAPDVDDSTLVLRRQARSFFQANRYLLEHLVARVIERVPPRPVVDLYAGVGLFACALAAVGRDAITAVEGDPVSAEDLQANAAPLPAVRVRDVAVERFLREPGIERPATLIVDPPRTGMSREAVVGILHWRPPRVVYVSCDVATLARDARRLVDAGYLLTHLECFDLFPNTPHVEVLAVFDLR
jgi:23S rRNA (uracil1939-C5)-methyltransferase